MGEFQSSLKGQLLLDGGKLNGSFFHRTVVLVCQHDADGAFGLVLNRDSGDKVGEKIVADLPDSLKEQTLFVGGPVQPGAVSYLHTDEFVPHANVMENLALGLSLEGLVDIGESYSTTQRVRVFAGYAGWSPGQLDEEVKRNAWVTHPASVELVFDSDPVALWKKILRTKGAVFRLLGEAPDDLSSN